MNQELIQWTFEQNSPVVVTTSFGNHSAVLLHMVYRINPKATILWIDTQFNTSSTLQFKEKMCKLLNLNIVSYVGKIWDEEIPAIDSSQHQEFVEQVKLAPFRRAVNSLRPKFWITGIRSEQTAYRNQVKQIDRSNEIIKISPLLKWTVKDMEEYLEAQHLPNEVNYFDPTKPVCCECGLQTVNFELGELK